MKAAASLTAMLASAPAIAGWEPTKPVEIVVAAGAGGASDQMARMMQAAIQKNHLMKQPMVVSLKGGASGVEAGGSRSHRVRGAEDRREILLSALQVGWRGGDAAGGQSHRLQRQQPIRK